MDEIKVMLDDGAYMPEKAHDADAGYDLRAMFDAELKPGGGAVFDTGVHVQIPEGCVGYVQGRSGLNVNHSIICPTGVVDEGFVGAIKVKLYNLSNEPYKFETGDKVAQLVIHPVVNRKALIRVNSLEETERGNNGFGSTGR